MKTLGKKVKFFLKNVVKILVQEKLENQNMAEIIHGIEMYP